MSGIREGGACSLAESKGERPRRRHGHFGDVRDEVFRRHGAQRLCDGSRLRGVSRCRRMLRMTQVADGAVAQHRVWLGAGALLRVIGAARIAGTAALIVLVMPPVTRLHIAFMLAIGRRRRPAEKSAWWW